MSRKKKSPCKKEEPKDLQVGTKPKCYCPTTYEIQQDMERQFDEDEPSI